VSDVCDNVLCECKYVTFYGNIRSYVTFYGNVSYVTFYGNTRVVNPCIEMLVYEVLMTMH
jgi:hypothetical protein